MPRPKANGFLSIFTNKSNGMTGELYIKNEFTGPSKPSRNTTNIAARLKRLHTIMAARAALHEPWPHECFQ
jgi:hypothetical protein